MSVNLGELGDQLYAKNEEIAQFNAQLKVIESEKKALEERLLTGMQEAGTNIVRGSKATISVSETIRAQIVDFEAFSRFLYKRKALYLMERRIASTAYRELKDSLPGNAVPGLSDFTQVRLNVRKAS